MFEKILLCAILAVKTVCACLYDGWVVRSDQRGSVAVGGEERQVTAKRGPLFTGKSSHSGWYVHVV
jgi:hypothetical protein